jgi:hypothetical protein
MKRFRYLAAAILIVALAALVPAAIVSASSATASIPAGPGGCCP